MRVNRLPFNMIRPHEATAGVETCDRLLNIAAGIQPASQSLRFGYFKAPRTETVANVNVCTAGTAAAATPTVCGMVLCSVAANGDLTVIAVTANDTSLFAAQNTDYKRAYTGSVEITAGNWYAHGSLVVSNFTMPALAGFSSFGAILSGQTNRPTLATRVGTVAALPAVNTVYTAASDLLSSGFFPYAYVGP